MAIPGHVGASDKHLRWMFNPNNPYYEQEPLYKPTGMLLKVNELIGGAVEEKIQFFQIRPEKALGTVGHHVYNLPMAADHHTGPYDIKTL